VTAKLEDTLNNANDSFTVFAPSNDAFGELAPGITALLTKAKEDTLLPELLKYHVLAKIVAKCQISGTQEEATLLTNQSVKVVEHDGNVTVGPQGTESKVTTADVMASNGVVHVIDKVMLPAALASQLPTEDLAKLANASGFTTLYTAIAAADPSVLALLTDEKAAITCFFPTNAAFAAVDQDELSSLLNDKSKLTRVMKGHCTSEYMPKKVLESRLQSGDVKVKAVGGQDLEIKKDGDDLTINKVKIVGTDSFANNGVYHSIDRVLFTGAGGRPVAFLFLGLVGLLATLF